MSDVKFIRAGRFVSPAGEDLGPAQAAAKAPEQPKADDRTVDELKAALDAKGVDYPSDAKKADLLKLAADKGV